MVFGDLVFPSRCAGCGTLGPSPCANCVDRLRPLTEIAVGGLVDRCLVLLDYDDLARRLVAKLKYDGVYTGVYWFAEALAERVRVAGEQPAIVTWVPAAGRNRRRRGFDQAELLATAIARRLDLPVARAVERSGGHRQTGARRADRLRGPDLALAASCRCVHENVLVVDDVVTTGASLRAAAAVLADAGARRVVAAVAAHRRFR